jgi:hypothetical protein
MNYDKQVQILGCYWELNPRYIHSLRLHIVAYISAANVALTIKLLLLNHSYFFVKQYHYIILLMY